MSKYILVDGLNLFHRARHVTGGSLDLKVGMSLHIMFSSIRKAYRDMGGDHVVLVLDGRSWRKDYYEPYKKNRKVVAAQMTQREREEMEVMQEAFSELAALFLDKTNATVLKGDNAEADDLIAMWIDLHPDDEHVILSSDSDFVQLVAPNVQLFNGVTGVIFQHDCAINDKGKRCAFEVTGHGKIKVGEPSEDFVAEPGWQDLALFIKCIRGDKSDNVFPAYPGVRFKGTKNKVGITEAYNDRNNGGYNWNNFMLQRWQDDRNETRIVKEEYERNRVLVDLRAQPEKFREQFVETIIQEVDKPRVSNVGIHFLRFCNEWELNNISKYPDEYAQILNTPYKGHLLKKEAA